MDLNGRGDHGGGRCRRQTDRRTMALAYTTEGPFNPSRIDGDGRRHGSDTRVPVRSFRHANRQTSEMELTDMRCDG